MTTISLAGLTKRFSGTAAVADVTLDFAQGSFTALLGPSGCGKTTLLRLIAGFEQPDAGSIGFDGATIATSASMVPPEKRHLGIVFQSYALWPHMNVAGNVAYPLKAQGVGRAETEARVRKALDMVSLQGFEDRSIDALSGGQRQRVALARCLIANTDVILLDEPLANLDVHLRAAMLDVFADIHARTGATIIYVTHDQAEALALADTIMVFDKGRLQQAASPETLYAEPANAMVGGFVGRGCIVAAQADAGELAIGDYRFFARSLAGQSGPVQVLLRPEGLHLVDNGLRAEIERVTYRGPVYETALRLPGGELVLLDTDRRLAPGSTIDIGISDAWVIPG